MSKYRLLAKQTDGIMYYDICGMDNAADRSHYQLSGNYDIVILDYLGQILKNNVRFTSIIWINVS